MKFEVAVATLFFVILLSLPCLAFDGTNDALAFCDAVGQDLDYPFSVAIGCCVVPWWDPFVEIVRVSKTGAPTMCLFGVTRLWPFSEFDEEDGVDSGLR